MIKIKNKYILAQTVEEKESSIIFVPEDAIDKPNIAKITHLDNMIKEFKIGDKVVHKEYGPTSIKLNKEVYLLMREDDIVAVL